MKKISIVTLFPEFIELYASFGIVARAVKNKLLNLRAVNLRGFAIDKRGTVDDRPYGGGLGMVLRPDVVIKAIQKVRGKVTAKPKLKTRIILMTPQGKPFTQTLARKLSKYDHLILVSGRYEGFDERVRKFVDEEISVGDYVLMGGELPSLVISEAVLRLVPGVLGKDDSAKAESFAQVKNVRGNAEALMLEYPQYTKPEVLEIKVRGKIKKMVVPKVLLSGHHVNIEKWRGEEALKRTKKRRPDLLK